MFNSIITSFQGYFSRSFWFASFLPVATVAALHVAIAEMAFPGWLPLRQWLDAGVADKAGGLSLLLVVLVVLAYALAPLTPLVRDMLGGRSLPNWLHNLLRTARVADWQRAKNEMAAALSAFNQFDLMNEKTVPKITEAAKKGDALGRLDDVSAITSVSALIRILQTQMQSSTIPDVSVAKDAASKLIFALERNSSKLGDGNSKLLGVAKERFIALIADARMEATYQLGRIGSTHSIDLLPTRLDLMPTRVADARRITERYSEDTYHVDFNYVWTRIQMVLPKEDKDNAFLSRLTDAQSQVSFSVLALLLTFTVPLVWLPVLFFTGTTPWLFVAVGVLSPVLVLLLYELVVQSQSVFGEVVRAAIDKYRISVLTDVMLQPLPTTLAAERALWQGLALASAPRNEINASLTHKGVTAQKT